MRPPPAMGIDGDGDDDCKKRIPPQKPATVLHNSHTGERVNHQERCVELCGLKK